MAMHCAKLRTTTPVSSTWILMNARNGSERVFLGRTGLGLETHLEADKVRDSSGWADHAVPGVTASLGLTESRRLSRLARSNDSVAVKV